MVVKQGDNETGRSGRMKPGFGKEIGPISCFGKTSVLSQAFSARR